MRESTIERYLHQQVTKAGGTTRKFVSPGHKDVPDRIVIWPLAGVHFVETKAPGKKPRAGQLREHARLRKLGCTVLTIESPKEVDTYVWGRE